MSKITMEEVKKVGQLARIQLNGQDLDKFGSQLAEVIDYIDLLNEVDVSEVEPTLQAIELGNVYGDDVIEKGLTAEEALSQAPHVAHSQFKVLKVFSEE